MIIAAKDFYAIPPHAIPQHVEDAFFSSIKNRNNTFKRTNARRFADLDRRLIAAIRSSRPKMRPDLLDIGISSGTTTLDLHDELVSAGFAPRITGTDLAIEARIVPLGAGVSALVGADGHPLQFDLPGFVLRPWARRLDWFNFMWLVRPALVKRLSERARRALREDGGTVQHVRLVTPRLTGHPAVEVVEDNVMALRDAFVGRFDVIRAANILNRDYFAASDLQRALGNLRSYLKGPGSLLFVVRTLASGEHHGTLFRMDGSGRLEVQGRIGDGSEVEQIALEC